MPFIRNSHCSFCGAAFSEGQPWPRQCASCAQTSYLNPLPVSVVLVPVGSGLLLVERAVHPHVGKLALPGGYIGIGESWQQAGAREVLEETGVTVDPDGIREFRVRSAPDGTVLIFGLAQPLAARSLPPFTANDEAAARVVMDQAVDLAFSLHTEVMAVYFASR